MPDPYEARLRKLERRTGILWTLLMIALIIGAIHVTAFVLNLVADAKQKTRTR